MIIVFASAACASSCPAWQRRTPMTGFVGRLNLVYNSGDGVGLSGGWFRG
jgi:hypothetical protein